MSPVGPDRASDPSTRTDGRTGGGGISTGGLFLVGLVIAVGIVGIVVPVLPGLPIIWGAGAWWAVADGGGVARWSVFAVMGVLLAVGTAAKYVLPARATAAGGAPRSTLLVGVLGAVVGFFCVPIVGLLLGGLAGIYLAELVRLGDGRAAAVTTKAAVVAFGVGLLIELGAGLAMAATWLVGALVF